jgi:hydroxymethylpyrimidine pyrophosphatase-like HAD family hydrolase
MAGGAMTFEALATDYDGTLAYDGIVDESTIDALKRARDRGLRLVMVTGRELNESLQHLCALRSFRSHRRGERGRGLRPRGGGS